MAADRMSENAPLDVLFKRAQERSLLLCLITGGKNDHKPTVGVTCRNAGRGRGWRGGGNLQ